jgi:hypothetical protein
MTSWLRSPEGLRISWEWQTTWSSWTCPATNFRALSLSRAFMRWSSCDSTATRQYKTSENHP